MCYSRGGKRQIPQEASDDFKLVCMEYETTLGNYIEM
jgi:hypothetical protein